MVLVIGTMVVVIFFMDKVIMVVVILMILITDHKSHSLGVVSIERYSWLQFKSPLNSALQLFVLVEGKTLWKPFDNCYCRLRLISTLKEHIMKSQCRWSWSQFSLIDNHDHDLGQIPLHKIPFPFDCFIETLCWVACPSLKSGTFYCFQLIFYFHWDSSN